MTNQIKMTNLAIQIQKMAKGLNRFSISDVFQIFPDVNEKEIYQILNFLEGVDLFPYTHHVETVCLLERK